MNQRFTLDRHSFEHFLAAASLVQSLQRTAANPTVTNNPPLLHFSLETLRAVDSGTLDLQSALERVSALALQIVGGDTAVAWLFSSDSMICRAAAGADLDDHHLRTALLLKLQSAGAFGTNSPSTLDLTRTLTTHSGALGSILIIALLPGRGIAGALAVFSDPSRTFTERNYANLRLLAGLAQYILGKWMAGFEGDSETPFLTSGEGPSRLADIVSSLDRSARVPFVPRAPDASSMPSRSIRDVTIPATDRIAPAGLPIHRFQPDPESQCLPAPVVSDDLEVRSPVAYSPVVHLPPVQALSADSAVIDSPVADSSTTESSAEVLFEVDSADTHSPLEDVGSRSVPQPSPEGVNQNVPALQRWDGWKKSFKSRRDHWIADTTLEMPAAMGAYGRVVAQAAPAVAILAVMSLFVGFLMGGRQPAAVGSMNPVAEAAGKPVPNNFPSASQNEPVILAAKKSTPTPTPAPGPTSHLQITDRETAASVDELSKFEVKNLQRVATFGDDQAAMELGMLYELGRRGLPQNCRKAAEWVTKAAHDGNVAAEYNLGLRYKDGDGVSANIEQAEIWLRKAASHKEPNAAHVLETLHVGTGL